MVGMADRSSHYQLIEDGLKARGLVFTDFIAERRPGVGWRTIAREITELTEVSITGEMLRRWFADRITYEVTVA